jgi:ubiquinone/menaquinone biosynthesis C-methylase UbiE
MPQQGWGQLSASGPENYEHTQVPSVFEPLALKFVERMALHPGQHVLDIACGTGIVARKAASIVGPTGSIVGVDFNPNMLRVARQYAPTDSARMEWRQGDAASLPCSDADFDVALCQQGLQFFPDKVGALREMRRVLKEEGVVGICVWRSVEHSPFHLAIAQALRSHCGDAIARQFQAPFGFGDPDVLQSAMIEAGFRNPFICVETIIRRLLPAEKSVPSSFASTPVGTAIAALQKGTIDAIVADVSAALLEYGDKTGLTVPQPTHIAIATK